MVRGARPGGQQGKEQRRKAAATGGVEMGGVVQRAVSDAT
jgi:hypothetical protein